MLDYVLEPCYYHHIPAAGPGLELPRQEMKER